MLLSEILRVVFGLIAVIGMIGVAAIAARRLGLVTASQGLVRHRRLSVVETLALDTRRRMMIVKCDDKEHVIILGQTSETLVDSGLTAPNAASHIENPPPQNPFASLGFLTRAFDKNDPHAATSVADKKDAA